MTSSTIMRAVRSAGALATVAFLGASCAASAPPAPPVDGPPPDTALAARVAASNAIERPLHLIFDWSLEEREGRFSGKGVTRVEPPARARLDLFGPRDEGYLVAALVGNDLRLRARENPPLPPPTLFWCVLGVFSPPPGAALVASTTSGTDLRLDYAGAEGRWRFEFRDGRLRNAEWTGRREGRRTVELRGTGVRGLPQRAEYRDDLAFVKLNLILQEAYEVDGFPSDIWDVGRRR